MDKSTPLLEARSVLAGGVPDDPTSNIVDRSYPAERLPFAKGYPILRKETLMAEPVSGQPTSCYLETGEAPHLLGRYLG